MAVDTPARIAVLGAGPIGLEAALYGRFLGYQVDIYDQGEIADSVRRWGHVQMFSPFELNASSLGLAALAAQDESYRAPGTASLLSGRDFADQYLLPLSQTDLLIDHLHPHTGVVAIAKHGLLKDQPIGATSRTDAAFELLLETAEGERRATADIVIDSTGTYRTPRWMGAGGMPAVGERALQSQIHYQLPDVLGRDREHFAGRRTLVVGHGYSAATTVVALADLARVRAGTEIVWLTRSAASSPITPLENDTLPGRVQLTAAANALAQDTQGPVQHLKGGEVSRLALTDAGAFEVEITGSDEARVGVDHIVAHVGLRPDNTIANELQVQHCYATEGPMKLAAHLLGEMSADCLAPATFDAQTLVTTEPRYFVLGSKSYGRNPHFLISKGLQQIRLVYSLLAGRHDLDLYANMKRLAP
jgi:thioredoxin reductase